MDNLSQIISNLQSENNRLEKELQKVRSAITVLSRLNGKSGRGAKVVGLRSRRVLSAAARRRIAQAQKARWAKWKAAKKAA
jgi:hypothetical protein